MKKLKIAFGYNAFSQRSIEYHENIVHQARTLGYDVYPVAISPTIGSPRLSFAELDKKVFWKDKHICKFRDKIIEQISSADVFWLFNGTNFHPSWIKLLPQKQLKIYGCHDDPESSPTLSLPVAAYFDAVITGNISVLTFYQGHINCEVSWLPLFQSLQPAQLSDADIAKENRPIDLVFLGERESIWRRKRFDYLQQAFPKGFFYGRGWPNGWIEDSSSIYLKSKIGINIHNSVGPVNIRLYELASHGVMQICDNKCRLGHIFKLSEEIIGYDYIDEAIEKINYYLDPKHEEERCQIAWKGYQRYLSDYTAEKIWQKAFSIIEPWYIKKESNSIQSRDYSFRKENNFSEYLSNTKNHIKYFYLETKDIAKKILHLKENWSTIDIKENISLNEAKMQADAQICQAPFDVTVEIISPDITALSYAITKLIGKAKNILAIDSLCLTFAYEAAQDPSRKITIINNKLHPYFNKFNPPRNITCLPEIKYIKNIFDLVVSINRININNNYKDFLYKASQLSQKAIFTIPQYGQSNLTQKDCFYILQQYYKKTYLFTMLDKYIPAIVPATFDSKTIDTPTIILCENESI